MVVDSYTVIGAAIFGSLCYLLYRKANSTDSKKVPPNRRRAASVGLTRLMHQGGFAENKIYDGVISLFIHFESKNKGDEPLNLNSVKDLFKKALLPYRNFRCVPKFLRSNAPLKTLAELEWMEPPTDPATGQPFFDDNYHFQEHLFDSAADMEKFVTDMANNGREIRGSPSDQLKSPWWKVHLLRVKGQKASPNGGKTVSHALIRIHHCIGDGISLVQAFNGVMSDAEGKEVDVTAAFNPSGRAGQKKKSFNPIGMLKLPFKALSFIGACFQILGLTKSTPDVTSAFHTPSLGPGVGTEGNPKRIQVYIPSHSVDLIKTIKTRLSQRVNKAVTINDVEFALFSGAVRRYMKHGDGITDVALSKVTMRSLTPLALPVKVKPEEKSFLGLRNYWAFMNARMPMHHGTALERAVEANKVWTGIKNSMMAPASFFLTTTAAKLPLALQQDTSFQLLSRFAVVFSNVPGPQMPIYVAGHKVTGSHMVFPNGPVQVGIFSVDGYMHHVMTMQEGGGQGKFVGQEQELMERFYMEELTELCITVGISEDEVKKNIRPKYY